MRKTVRRRRLAKSTQALAVVGYVRVSTEDQADSGAGLAAQKSAIALEADRRGWRLLAIHEDAGISGKAMANRPALAAALAAVEAGEADALVVAKLDRLSRSMLDAATLLERAGREGWALVVLDLGIDLTTPAGEAMAGMAAVFSQFERKLIAQRTKAAMAAKRAAGARFGRPRQLPVAVVERIVSDRAAGSTLQAIADALEAEDVATAQGGARWYPATVAAVLRSGALDVDAATRTQAA